MGFESIISSFTGSLSSLGGAGLRTMGGNLTKNLLTSFPPINAAISAGLDTASRLAGNYLSSSLNKMASGGGTNMSYGQQLQNIPGLQNQTARYVFEKSTVTNNLRTNAIEYSGYNTDIQGAAPPEYVIKVQNSRNWIVRGVMQEGFRMYSASEWAPFVPFNIDKMVNYITQLVSGMSLMSKWMTRRIWVGTSPIELNVTFKFNAVSNEWREVVLPCMRLQQMVLPSLPNRGSVYEALPLIQPPGPSPFRIKDDLTVDNTQNTGVNYYIDQANNIIVNRGDLIIITIGRFLKFTNVIIKDVQITYSPKMTRLGFPISSEARVKFETYEMMTLEDLEDKVHIIKG